MAGREQIAWPAKVDLERILDDAGNLKATAEVLGSSAPGLRHHCAKIGIDLPRPAWKKTLKVKAPPTARPLTEVRGDAATVITEARADVDLGDLDKLLRDRGLNPADWEVDRAKLNEWDALARGGDDPEVVTLRQLTAHLKRRAPLHWLFPASDVKQRPAPKPRRDPERPRLVVFLADPHCPFHDSELDKRVGEFLHALQPDRVISPGDVCDFGSISRHRDNPAWMAQAQENIQAGFEWWARKRDAAPDAEMDWVEGNHDARLRTELLERAERMYGLKPAEIPGEPEQYDALSLRRLCHLDRLNVRFVGPPREGDNYFHGALDLAPEVCVRHGWLTGANSAEKTVERLGMTVFFGHTHYMRVVYKTIYRGAEPVAERLGIGCGTLAQIQGGLGYAGNPDWHPGLVTATIWPDGGFTYDLARWDGKRLTWRDRRF